jgi:hypothetical protein
MAGETPPHLVALGNVYKDRFLPAFKNVLRILPNNPGDSLQKRLHDGAAHAFVDKTTWRFFVCADAEASLFLQKIDQVFLTKDTETANWFTEHGYIMAQTAFMALFPFAVMQHCEENVMPMPQTWAECFRVAPRESFYWRVWSDILLPMNHEEKDSFYGEGMSFLRTAAVKGRTVSPLRYTEESTDTISEESVNTVFDHRDSTIVEEPQ